MSRYKGNINMFLLCAKKTLERPFQRKKKQLIEIKREGGSLVGVGKKELDSVASCRNGDYEIFHPWADPRTLNPL